MSRKLSWVSLSLILMLFPAQAYAQWFYKKDENAFDEKKSTHIAVTANSSGYALGARCINGDLTVIYMTTEGGIDKSTLKIMNLTGPKMLIRVDSAPVKEIAVDLNEVEGKLIAIIENGDAKAVMEEIVKSKERVAVTLKMMDKMFHNNNFSSKGSSGNIKKVLEGCKS